MDLRKAENQNADAQSRDRSVERLRSFVQDLLCFLILFMIALLVVSAVFFLVDDWSNVHQSNQKRRLIMKVQHQKDVVPSTIPPDSTYQDHRSRQMKEYYIPLKWWRALFRCPHQRTEKIGDGKSVGQSTGSVSDESLLGNSSSPVELDEIDEMDELTKTEHV